jgi:hypothetical protein
MIVEVHDAPKSAGAWEEKMQAAATVLANADNRFGHVDSAISALAAKINNGFTRVDAEILVVKDELSLVK